MNRAKAVSTLVAVLLCAGVSAPALAWGHAHIRFGVFVGVPFYPWYAPYYFPPPVVAVPAAPTTYVEQGSAPAPSPSYWYYCADSRTYYPYVKECPGGWMRVVPNATPPAPQPRATPPSAPLSKPQSLPQTASRG